MNFLGMGPTELLVVLVIALIVLGPNKMVEVARSLGKIMRDLQRAGAELPRLISLEDDAPAKPPPQRLQVQEPAKDAKDQPPKSSPEP